MLFFFLMIRLPPRSTLFPCTTLLRSGRGQRPQRGGEEQGVRPDAVLRLPAARPGRRAGLGLRGLELLALETQRVRRQLHRSRDGEGLPLGRRVPHKIRSMIKTAGRWTGRPVNLPVATSTSRSEERRV